MSAVTNYHKLGNLRQNKSIILKLWTSEVQNRSPWASNSAGRTVSSGGSWRESFPTPLQLLEVSVFFGSWLLPPSRIIAPSQRVLV